MRPSTRDRIVGTAMRAVDIVNAWISALHEAAGVNRDRLSGDRPTLVAGEE